MKLSRPQFGVRKNPDLSRVHGLRPSVSSSSPEPVRKFDKTQDQAEASLSPPREVQLFDLPLTDTADEATAVRQRDGSEFLTVEEVAVRLCLSRNWIYNHADALGVYHLGKYLRFSWCRVLERLEK
jgi:hypothetical protein